MIELIITESCFNVLWHRIAIRRNKESLKFVYLCILHYQHTFYILYLSFHLIASVLNITNIFVSTANLILLS